MPPAPMAAVTSNEPIRVPTARDIVRCRLS
jgi:hypothetical protein